MANTKTRLDWFPLDVDFYDDPKVAPLILKYGEAGENLFIKLLCAVYREGYFMKWNDAAKCKAKRSSSLDTPEIEDAVEMLIEHDFYDREMFENEGILTSRGIQTRWIRIARRRKNEHLSYLMAGINDTEDDRAPKRVKKDPSTPTLADVKKHFTENGYTEDAATKAYNYYKDRDWKNSKGNFVKNWKASMGEQWFTDEHKIDQKKDWDINELL